MSFISLCLECTLGSKTLQREIRTLSSDWKSVGPQSRFWCRVGERSNMGAKAMIGIFSTGKGASESCVDSAQLLLKIIHPSWSSSLPRFVPMLCAQARWHLPKLSHGDGCFTTASQQGPNINWKDNLQHPHSLETFYSVVCPVCLESHWEEG